jgi:N6-adenosine-specific RNA methylase IME4/ParB-like chromosome segregation protein Spo0J
MSHPRVPPMPPVHPAADLFPMLPDAELRALADDIRANGLQQPIVMYGAHLLDGRNRWRACELAGVEVKIRDWQGSQDQALRYVISLNLTRRHLDESQRAMVAARVATMRQGERTDLAAIDARSQGEAADLLNVSRESAQRARKVIEKGTPELAAAVDAGKVAVSTAAVLTEAPAEKQREIVARGEKEILAAAKDIRAKKTEARRVERIEIIQKASAGNRPLEMGRLYPVILIDDPWKYQDEGSRGAAANHYPTEDNKGLYEVPVEKHATPDAILFMWAVSPLLPLAFPLMAARGFEYRSSIVWDKEVMGVGHWARIEHEFLLIGVRGNMPPPPPPARPRSIIHAKRGEHSAKPVEAYALIERMYPELPRLELFARGARPGWDRWGNQAPEGGA